MAYSADTFVADEQPTTAKWNKLWSNDASFNDGTGIGAVVGSQHFLTGVPVQLVSTMYSAASTTTSLIPEDDTVPQITEGTEFMTQAITPKSATNRLFIRARAHVSPSNINDTIGALFQDANANALAGNIRSSSGASAMPGLDIEHDMVAGTTSATTFRVRLGLALAGTLTFNGFGGARKLGGISLSSISILEYKAL